MWVAAHIGIISKAGSVLRVAEFDDFADARTAGFVLYGAVVDQVNYQFNVLLVGMAGVGS